MPLKNLTWICVGVTVTWLVNWWLYIDSNCISLGSGSCTVLFLCIFMFWFVVRWCFLHVWSTCELKQMLLLAFSQVSTDVFGWKHVVSESLVQGQLMCVCVFSVFFSSSSLILDSSILQQLKLTRDTSIKVWATLLSLLYRLQRSTLRNKAAIRSLVFRLSSFWYLWTQQASSII